MRVVKLSLIILSSPLMVAGDTTQNPAALPYTISLNATYPSVSWMPSEEPSRTPTGSSSPSDSSAPSSIPSEVPSGAPSTSISPSASPSSSLTEKPFIDFGSPVFATTMPSSVPSLSSETPTETPPSMSPTNAPTRSPTNSPTGTPTKTPTKAPTRTPTKAPTKIPTKIPTKAPTRSPTKTPTRSPTKTPTRSPTKTPTRKPTKTPTRKPTKTPTRKPTKTPTRKPTKAPTSTPTKAPTQYTTKSPTKSPSKSPTKPPTYSPVQTATKSPTKSPTYSPVQATKSPTKAPVYTPVQATKSPTKSPTYSPVQATKSPTKAPVYTPVQATKSPTKSPIYSPVQATKSPTKVPVYTPVQATKSPTTAPAASSSKTPTRVPTAFPIQVPTKGPTKSPSVTSGSQVSVKDILDTAKERIRETIIADPKIAATYLRLGFHDCVPNGSALGGCDGCINLATNDDNNGLLPAVRALAPIVAELENPVLKISRADIWAYSGLVACDLSQSNITFTDNFKVGRTTCEERRTCTGNPVFCSTNGPDTVADFPHPDMTTHEVLDFMNEHFGFNSDQTVAILGAHTLGRALQQNFGYNGPDGWVNNPLLLDNEYYKLITGGDSSNNANTNVEILATTPDWKIIEVNNAAFGFRNNHQWVLPNANPNAADIIMMNVDMALVRDLSGEPNPGFARCKFTGAKKSRCPLATQTLTKAGMYRANNMVWLNDFKKVMNIMLEKNM